MKTVTGRDDDVPEEYKDPNAPNNTEHGICHIQNCSQEQSEESNSDDTSEYDQESEENFKGLEQN